MEYCAAIQKDEFMAHACNVSILGGQAGGSQGQEVELFLANMVKLSLY